jgi:uncharacterized protein (DUF433 family)
MDYRERIVLDPKIRFGNPYVRGTCITVGDVLSHPVSGMSENDILADFPQFDRADIRACPAFAAERERRVTSVPQPEPIRLLFDENLSGKTPPFLHWRERTGIVASQRRPHARRQ